MQELSYRLYGGFLEWIDEIKEAIDRRDIAFERMNKTVGYNEIVWGEAKNAIKHLNSIIRMAHDEYYEKHPIADDCMSFAKMFNR